MNARHTGSVVGIAFFVALAAMFGLTLWGIIPSLDVAVSWPATNRENSARYVPSFSEPQDQELVLVYFGAASCGWCNNPRLPGVIDSAIVAVRDHAAARGASFSAVGISVDWDAKAGVAHLDKIGRFDEIAAGRSAFGLGARTYMHLLHGTPQISVLKRSSSDKEEEYFQHFTEDELVRKSSLARIADWVQRGAPTPVGTD